MVLYWNKRKMFASDFNFQTSNVALLVFRQPAGHLKAVYFLVLFIFIRHIGVVLCLWQTTVAVSDIYCRQCCCWCSCTLKKYLHGKLLICSLHGRHLHICFSKLSIWNVWKHVGPVLMSNFKIFICFKV